MVFQRRRVKHITLGRCSWAPPRYSCTLSWKVIEWAFRAISFEGGDEGVLHVGREGSIYDQEGKLTDCIIIHKDQFPLLRARLSFRALLPSGLAMRFALANEI